ncbi:aminotransferase class I/II-fold pyridoxal phosphate-dependent enzyme [Pseudomonas sp. PD9R]|uniref:aminotransferase class I/II-fold pyridoxal phosphate-dependent enzyme n=1 Tax=Pseudomonas sp. PD9R TaxID=2853534 RepID=UPI001C43CD68|nr:aminotransferase class I/II-fold pyridoxal phosphate-dependent enzyme [Pseudomonas sp. PD9R]MBV6824198.1 aminotransferase [Pseudomonas sp. PD9R]
MNIFAGFDKRPGELTRQQLEDCYYRVMNNPLDINMTRGLPSPAQLDLANSFLFLPGQSSFVSAHAVDWRNYGCLQGLPEVRKLVAEALLGLPADQIAVGENSSLALMHETLGYAFSHGLCTSPRPWGKEPLVKFLCPVPGYDRHFAMCEEFNIEMIPVPLLETGPDMDMIERLVASDPTIKGMWCVPKYSNPSGAVYCGETVARLARMPTAADDFVLFWDNAYAVHHLTDDEVQNQPIAQLCEEARHTDRYFIFASTSKIVLPGAGLAFIGSSTTNLTWWLNHRKCRTIGPDKVNQLRHLLFFRDDKGVSNHMKKHRSLLAPKFERLEVELSKGFNGVGQVSWTRPQGGYFVSLDLPQGCASRAVDLALRVGLALTQAGATHPKGLDPLDSNIRLAPTYLDLETLGVAAQVLVLCVLLSIAQQERTR